MQLSKILEPVHTQPKTMMQFLSSQEIEDRPWKIIIFLFIGLSYGFLILLITRISDIYRLYNESPVVLYYLDPPGEDEPYITQITNGFFTVFQSGPLWSDYSLSLGNLTMLVLLLVIACTIYLAHKYPLRHVYLLSSFLWLVIIRLISVELILQFRPWYGSLVELGDHILPLPLSFVLVFLTWKPIDKWSRDDPVYWKRLIIGLYVILISLYFLVFLIGFGLIYYDD